MGFRFRRSISILPGVRINLNNGTPSVSLGPRGASISIGSQGTYANVGLPGSGLSYRQRIGGHHQHDSSNVTYPSLQELEKQASAINGDMDWILNIHADTPSPATGRLGDSLLELYLHQQQQPFEIPAPIRPSKPEPLAKPVQPKIEDGGFFSLLLTSEQQRQHKLAEQMQYWQKDIADWEQANKFAIACYEKNRAAWAEQYAIWKADKDAHAARMEANVDELVKQFLASPSFFEQMLMNDLSKLSWPRETTFSFEVNLSNSSVSIDVDLPEYEDIPPKVASLNAKQNALIIKGKTDKQRRLEYARHVHGCLFRIIGEVFDSLPIEQVIVAGFTQRLNSATGNINDDYILECTVNRAQFSSLNFNNLELVDPISALESFSLVRNMTSTGIFKTIEVN